MACPLTFVSPQLRGFTCRNYYSNITSNSKCAQFKSKRHACDFQNLLQQQYPARTFFRICCSQGSLHCPSSLVTVRQAHLADLNALVAIEDSSRPGGHWTRSSLQAELERERAMVVLAEKVQSPVGLLVVWTVPPDELHVLELAVLPSHRRQGIARQMLTWAFSKHRNVTETVLLEVRRSNCAAQQLYKSLGFETVGERKKYYDDGESAVLMNMDLKSMSS